MSAELRATRPLMARPGSRTRPAAVGAEPVDGEENAGGLESMARLPNSKRGRRVARESRVTDGKLGRTGHTRHGGGSRRRAAPRAFRSTARKIRVCRSGDSEKVPDPYTPCEGVAFIRFHAIDLLDQLAG